MLSVLHLRRKVFVFSSWSCKRRRRPSCTPAGLRKAIFKPTCRVSHNMGCTHRKLGKLHDAMKTQHVVGMAQMGFHESRALIKGFFFCELPRAKPGRRALRCLKTSGNGHALGESGGRGKELVQVSVDHVGCSITQYLFVSGSSSSSSSSSSSASSSSFCWAGEGGRGR